jgi:hypothetical protein
MQGTKRTRTYVSTDTNARGYVEDITSSRRIADGERYICEGGICMYGSDENKCMIDGYHMHWNFSILTPCHKCMEWSNACICVCNSCNSLCKYCYCAERSLKRNIGEI